MINSKQKGKRYELELVRMLKTEGYEVRRTAQYCGNTGEAADVIGLPGIHIEAKHVEKLNIYDAMAQAIHDSKGNLPTVFHRKNDCKTLVTMRFEDWMKLYRDWEVSGCKK